MKKVNSNISSLEKNVVIAILANICKNFRNIFKEELHGRFSSKDFHTFYLWVFDDNFEFRKGAIFWRNFKIYFVLIIRVSLRTPHHRFCFSLQITVTKNKTPSLGVGFVGNCVAQCSSVLYLKPSSPSEFTWSTASCLFM